MKKRILALLMTFSLAATLLPTVALAENVENEETPIAQSESSTQSESITTYAALKNAITAAKDGATIAISGKISIDEPLVFNKSIILTGGGTIVPSDEFKDLRYLVTLQTANKTLTLGNITLDAQQKCRVVYCTAGKIVVDGATITGGKRKDAYIGGVFMTKDSQFEMNSGSITGNVNATYTNDGYLQYAADLWIGANANGELAAINGGTIGSIFVNSNEYSENNPGGFTMNGGSVKNLYVEYGKGHGASFTYNGGEIENLYISTTKGDGNKVQVTPIAGVAYAGGQTGADVTAPVAQVGNKTYASLADAIIAAQNGSTVKLLKGVTLDSMISVGNGKTLTLDLNGCTVSAELAMDSMIRNEGTLTITDSSAKNGEIVKSGSARNSGYVIANSGVMVINGGKFTNSVDGGAVLNSNDLTINDGVFTGAPAVLTSKGAAAADITTKIKNGTFNGAVNTSGDGVSVSVTGGTFSADLTTAPGYGAVKIGDVYKVGKEYTISRKYSPDNATFVVMNKTTGQEVTWAGNVVDMSLGYTLNEACEYTYTVSAPGYITKTGAIEGIGQGGTLEVYLERQHSSPSGGSNSSNSSGSGTVKNDTVTNPDGSVTKTETKRDGTVIETTTGKDGSVSKTTTNPNGSSVTETKAADGSTGTVKTDERGQTTAETTLSSKAIETAKKNGEPVTAPVEVKATRDSSTAPTVKIELPRNSGDTKVEIPVTNVKPGTVAVIVHPDGTEEIVKNSLPTEDGIQLTVNGGATVKIVDNSKDFIDTQNHWAKDAIDFVSARDLVNGMNAVSYAPDASTTRAQLWTILARQNDTDLSGGTNWYEKAQLWAKDKGVSDGANPDGTINRAQMVTMLWRTMGQPAAASGASFADVPADSYYAQAVAWAVENGITTGVGDGRFDPNGACTRGQIATFLYRYMK